MAGYICRTCGLTVGWEGDFNISKSAKCPTCNRPYCFYDTPGPIPPDSVLIDLYCSSWEKIKMMHEESWSHLLQHNSQAAQEADWLTFAELCRLFATEGDNAVRVEVPDALDVRESSEDGETLGTSHQEHQEATR